MMRFQQVIPLLVVLAIAGHCVDARKIYGVPGEAVVFDEDTTPATIADVTGATILAGILRVENSFCSNAILGSTAEANLITALQNVREIRGHASLKIFECISSHEYLSNLVVIHGEQNALGAALTIESSPAAGRPLRHIGLNSLTRVQGGITILGFTDFNTNNFLCGKGSKAGLEGVDYFSLVPHHTIDYDNVTTVGAATERQIGLIAGNDTEATYVIDLTNEDVAGFCPSPYCNAGCPTPSCWGPDLDNCQKICDSSCGDEGCRPDTTTCCAASCLGGCDASGACFVCAPGYLQDENGNCVSSCPATAPLPWGYVVVASTDTSCLEVSQQIQSPYACVDACISNTAISDGTCVIKCPGLQAPIGDPATCPPLSEGSDKVCDIGLVLQCKFQLDIIRNSDCDTIVGFVNVNVGSSINQASRFELNSLLQVRKITGDVIFSQTVFKDFSFLANVEEMQGRLIAVRNDRLVELGFQKLRSVNSVIIRDNFQLCYNDKPDWAEMGATSVSLVFSKSFLEDPTILLAAQAIGIENYVNRSNAPECEGDAIYPFTTRVQFLDYSLANFTTVEERLARSSIAELLGLPYTTVVVTNITEGSAILDLEVRAYKAPSSAESARSLVESSLTFNPALGAIGTVVVDSSVGLGEESICHPDCVDRGCFGIGDDECQPCVDPNQVLQEGKCVDECSDNFFLENGVICKRCALDLCATCTGPDAEDCTSCALDKFLTLGFGCADECDTDEYADTQSRCNACLPTCTSCSDGLTCDTCSAPLYLDGDQCVPGGMCPPGTHPNPSFQEQGAVCETCNPNCKECGGTKDTCTECDSSAGLVLQTGKCQADCDPKFFENTVNNTCDACDFRCKVCSGPLNTECTECDGANFLIETNNTCVDVLNCPLGWIPNVQDLTCVECGQDCETCFIAGPDVLPCRLCMNNKRLHDGECFADCPVNNYQLADPFFGDTCEGCDICTETEWESTPCTPLTNRVCNECTVCDPVTEFQQTACQEDADTDCQPLDDCDFSTQYLAAPATLTSNNDCVNLIPECDTLTHYESKPPTTTSQRECSLLTICDSAFYISTPATYSSDRACTRLTVCDSLKEYQFSPPSTFSDRDCRNCTECNPANSFLLSGCNGVSNSNCEIIDRCATDPCFNNATCINNNGFNSSCACIDEWSGDLCEFWGPAVETCSNATLNPCFEGDCNPVRNQESFECDCNTGWQGSRCDIFVEAQRQCDEENPCINGVCEAPRRSRTLACVCDEGWGGSFCDEEDAVGASKAAGNATTLAAVGAAAGLALILAVLIAVYYKRKPQFKEEIPMRPEKPDHWEIDRELLTVGKMIGEGHFGQVHKALYMDPSLQEDRNATLLQAPATDVAIKLLKEAGEGTQEEKDFWAEMKLMKEIGKHDNVVSLVGVVTLEKPYMIVIEFCENGDLKGYLRDRRATATRPALLGPDDFLNFCLQIANGMTFLSNLKIIHRDLATRNILVSKDMKLKVSDFGLARDVYEEDFYQKTSKGKMPFKWMAPEALIDRVFTTQSDVWSFGIVMWEITTYGAAPYPTVQNNAILELLQNGYRMPKPEACTEEMYQVMRSCWEWYPADRPLFGNIRSTFATMSGIDPQVFIDKDNELYSTYQDPEAAAGYGAAGGSYEMPVAGEGGDYQEPGENDQATYDFAEEDHVFDRKASTRTKDSIDSFKPVTLRNAGFEPAEDDNDGAVYDVADGVADGHIAPRSQDSVMRHKTQWKKPEVDEEEDGAIYDEGDNVEAMQKAFPARTPTTNSKDGYVEVALVNGSRVLRASQKAKAAKQVTEEVQSDALYDIADAPNVPTGAMSKNTSQHLLYDNADEDEYDNMDGVDFQDDYG